VVLDQVDSRSDGSDGRPETKGLDHNPHSCTVVVIGLVLVVGLVLERGAWGQSTIDQNVSGSVDLGDIDDALVQAVVASITDQLLECRVVLLAGADTVFGATANDGLALVLIGSLVVVLVVVRVVVGVGAAQPETGPESESGTTEQQGRSETAARASGPVRGASTTSVEASTLTEARLGARARETGAAGSRAGLGVCRSAATAAASVSAATTTTAAATTADLAAAGLSTATTTAASAASFTLVQIVFVALRVRCDPHDVAPWLDAQGRHRRQECEEIECEVGPHCDGFVCSRAVERNSIKYEMI